MASKITFNITYEHGKFILDSKVLLSNNTFFGGNETFSSLKDTINEIDKLLKEARENENGTNEEGIKHSYDKDIGEN